MGRQSSWWEADLQPFLSPSLGGTCAWSPEGAGNGRGWAPGRRGFLLGCLIPCSLFALWAAEKSSGWWDC